MRLLVETFQDGKVRLFKDRSLYGLPRWVVDDGESITIYSKIWFSLKDIKAIYENN